MLSYKEAVSGEDKDKWLKAIEKKSPYSRRIVFFSLLMAKKSQEVRITPGVLRIDNSDDCNEMEGVNFPYREAVGSPLYLSNRSIPDIKYAVNMASIKVDNPTVHDVKKSKWIFSSLIDASSEADYACDETSCRSTSGYVILYMESCCLVCKKTANHITQYCIKRIHRHQTCLFLKFLKSLYKELTGKFILVNLNIGNQSTIQLIKNYSMTKKSKHVDIKFKFLSEKETQENFSLKYCPTDSQLADIFTKA
ncbi:hypothetical protein PR048_005467, partial [Dryococelus australis]